MGVLAWVVAPWLRDQLGGHERLAQALLILLTLGLIWQFVLVLILIRHELGDSNGRACAMLYGCGRPVIRRPGAWVDGCGGGCSLHPHLRSRAVLPGIHGPSMRDFGDFASSHAGKEFFRGAWGWFAVVVVLLIFNTVLGEELLFRGLLLPRMKGVFGKYAGSPTGCCSDLPPASAVDDPHRSGGHLRPRLSLAAVPERVDGDHRALDSERLLHHRPPDPRG